MIQQRTMNQPSSVVGHQIEKKHSLLRFSFPKRRFSSRTKGFRRGDRESNGREREREGLDGPELSTRK